MRTLRALLAGTVAALAVQPLVLFCWLIAPALLLGPSFTLREAAEMCFFTVLFAVPFVVLLGIPLSLLLHRTGIFKWWPLALAGAIAGGIFAGWSGPGSSPGFSSGGNWYGKSVSFIIDGEPTFYGWLNYLQSVATFAIHGFIGASAYYYAWVRSIGPNNSSKPTSLRGAA